MDGSELTTQDLADTLEYWKSRAIQAEKLLQGYIDRELGNTLREPTMTPWMQGALDVMRSARERADDACSKCRGRGWGAVVNGDRIVCDACGGTGIL